MKQYFKRLVLMIVVFIMVFTETSCTWNFNSDNFEKSSLDKKTTLKLWHIWAVESEANRAPFLKVLGDFQKTFPNISLEVDDTEAQTYNTRIKLAAAVNELPDVFYYLGGGLLKSFVKANKVLCFDEYLNDGTKERIIPGSLSQMTFDGKVYGLPYTQACAVFYVNKELFEENNVKIPETYQELIDAVKAFRRKGITPMTVGAKDDWTIAQYFDLLAVRTAGYTICRNALSNNGSFEDPALVESARKFQELVRIGAFNEGALGLTRDEAEVPFYEGRIPMYVNGNWICGNIEKDSSVIKGKVLALKFPIVEDGKGYINDFTGGVADVFCASSSTKFKDEAATTVKFISEHHSKAAFLSGAGIPTWKFSYDKSAVNPLMQQIINNTEEATSYTMWWNTTLESKDSETYLDALQQLFSLKYSPEQFCKELQKINLDK